MATAMAIITVITTVIIMAGAEAQGEREGMSNLDYQVMRL